MKKIYLKYKSKCDDTGKLLNRGELAYYDKESKNVYCLESEKAASIIECNNTRAYIIAQEFAYFDKFFSLNNKPE